MGMGFENKAKRRIKRRWLYLSIWQESQVFEPKQKSNSSKRDPSLISGVQVTHQIWRRRACRPDPTDESNDVVTPGCRLGSHGSKHFVKPVLPFPLQPPNQPSPSTQSLPMALPDPAAISCSSAPNPNERIPFPVPSQEQKDKHNLGSIAHLVTCTWDGGRICARSLARRNPPRESIDKGGGRWEWIG